MAQVKLDLRGKDIPGKIQKGRLVLTKIGTPPPAEYAALAVELKADTDKLETTSNQTAAMEQAITTQHDHQDADEATFDRSYGALGGQVQVTSKGDVDAIRANGFDVRADAGASVTELPAVGGFSVTTSNTPGVFDFAWDRMAGGDNFELRWHKQGDTPAGPSAGSKFTSRTRLRRGGFESGATWEFEIRAHGANETEGAWTGPFAKVAA